MSINSHNSSGGSKYSNITPNFHTINPADIANTQLMKSKEDPKNDSKAIFQNVHNGDSQTNSKAGSGDSCVTFKNVNSNPNYQGSISNPQNIGPMDNKQIEELKESSLSMEANPKKDEDKKQSSNKNSLEKFLDFDMVSDIVTKLDDLTSSNQALTNKLDGLVSSNQALTNKLDGLTSTLISSNQTLSNKMDGMLNKMDGAISKMGEAISTMENSVKNQGDLAKVIKDLVENIKKD